MQALKHHFSDKTFILSFFSGSILLIVSFVVNFFAAGYATKAGSGSVADLVLSNTPVYNVDTIFVYGTVFLFFFWLVICVKKINTVPFMIKSWAFFILVRSFFITLTHLSPFPNHVTVSSAFFQEAMFRGIFTGNDLFFSGHTGVPFLLALMFWDNKPLRYIFLGFSLMFAVVVLLGHIHYSIDVLSAFFIAYGIFHICIRLFKKDWELFQQKQSP